jgi:tRNA dimethylallyltransferase
MDKENNLEKPVIIITGPTACGKSETAILLAQAIGGEIISADSMQVYRGMDIGTAKTPEGERRGIPHHLIDICSPAERFSVADYQKSANEAIRAVYNRGNRPIICGGTGQYISALTRGLVFSRVTADYTFRSELNQTADREGTEALHVELSRQDPEAAARISPNDRKRLIRALEMIRQSGRAQREHLDDSLKQGPVFSFMTFCLNCDRPVLYEKINRRVLDMIEKGLENEVKTLLKQGAPLDGTCLQAIGYKEMIPYLEGCVSLADTITTIQQATRRYAKRQLTWFRHMDGLTWLMNGSLYENCQKILSDL